MHALTERERKILELAHQGKSDYKIARHLESDVANVCRSRKNAVKKIRQAQSDLEWAKEHCPKLFGAEVC